MALALAAAATVLACTQGELGTEADVPATLFVSPVFMIVPDDIESGPIDQIRMVARDADTDEEVATFDGQVDPNADEWAIDLAIDLDGMVSREVVVEVELLSGGTVEWSGRLGPIVVTGSGTPNVQQVEVFPGPLDNLDVEAVTILTAPVVLTVGATATLEAIATLATGSDATPVISWVSLDPTIIEIQSVSGNQITVEALAPGTVTVGAAAGSQTDAVDIEVVDLPSGPKTWVGGDPAGSTDWFIHENWSPVGVPTINDDVLIDPNGVSDPVLTASFQIRSLVTDVEVSVDLGGLSHFVNGGDISALGALFNGTVIATDPGNATVAGVFDGLSVSADRSLGGTVSAGIVRVNQGALTVGPNLLNTTGELRLVSFPGTSALVMDDPLSIVQVGSNLSFQGTDHDGLLTAGQLFIRGDLEASGTRFVATGSHLTNFNGLTPQSISLGTAGPSSARFHDLTISGADVDVSTDVHVSGDLIVTGTFTVPVGRTVDVDGSITLQSGASLTVDGTLTTVGGCVDNGATISGSGTSPCLPQLTTVTWVGGIGSVPNSVEDPLNWSPPQIPDAFSNVVVPVTANDPVAPLGGVRQLASISVAEGASLDLGGGSLEITGDITTGSVGIFNGVTRAVGTSPRLAGTFQELQIIANRSVTDALTTTGALILDDAELEVERGPVDVGTNLSLTGINAVLGMQDPTVVIDVAGDVSFAGGSHTNRLTAGELLVGGDFSASGLSAAFVAFGTHRVTFDGTGPQTVQFTNPGIVGHRFNDVFFENTASSIDFLSDVYAEGVVSVATGATVNAADDFLGVAGGLIDDAGGLTVQTVEVLGDLSDFPATLTGDIIVQTTWNLPGSLDLFGNLTLNNNDLSIGGNTLTVSDDFTITGPGAQLTMDDPNGLLDIDGNAVFGGSGQTNQLSAGEIQLAGDLTVTGSSSAMAADPTHLVTLDGTGDQTLNFSSPGIFDQHVFDLTVANSGGSIIFASDVAVKGTFTVPAGVGVSGPTFGLIVGEGFQDGSDGVSLGRLDIEGDLSVMDNFGSGDVNVLANFIAPSGFFVGGDLNVEADLIVSDNTINVSQNLNVQGVAGRLVMTNPSGAVNVNGNATINGASHVGALISGTLDIEGDFQVIGPATSFIASSTHLTRFTGLATQTVQFETPGPTAQRFGSVSFENSFGVDLLSDAAATGAFTVTPNSVLNGADDVFSVGGSFSNQGNTQLSELNITGALTAIDATIPFDTRISADYALPAGWTVNGDLTVDGALATMPGSTILVQQNFSVINNGVFQMQNGQGTMNVVGDVDFQGGSHSGQLTAGILQLLGNFNASGNALAFVGTGTHEVRFVGSLPQLVTFDNPGPTRQRFQNMDVRNFSGSVDLGTDTYVMGTFDFDDGDMNRAAPGATLFVRGTLLLSEATFIGLPVDLDSTVPVLSHSLNLVTFQGMDGNDTQFRARLPGSGQIPGLQATDFTFDQVLTPTGRYVDVSSNNAQGWSLLMAGTPSPGSPGTGGFITDGIASVIWPWP